MNFFKDSPEEFIENRCRKNKKNLPDDQYISLLEREIGSLYRAYKDYRKSVDEKDERLSKLITAWEESSSINIRDTHILVEKLKGRIKKNEEQVAKFKGKKVSKTRAKIYGEIEKKYLELNEEGANIGYIHAVNIIAKKHGKSSEKLYQAFKKWRNRQNVKSK